MKDFLTDDGIKDVFGSKTATQQAFNKDLIENGEIWMDMINSRTESVHTYNESTAKKISEKVITIYFNEFNNFQTKMKNLL